MKRISKFITLTLCAVLLFSTIVIAAPKKKSVKSNASNVQAIFDAQYYASLYPDVAAIYGNDYNALLNHYLTYGISEGRTGSKTFNVAGYKAMNPDLAAIYGNDWDKYVAHYAKYGKKEGRGNGITAPTVSQANANSKANAQLGSMSVNNLVYNNSSTNVLNVSSNSSNLGNMALSNAQAIAIQQAVASGQASPEYINFVLTAENLSFAGLSNSGNVVIPSTFTVDGKTYQVVGINADAFHGSSGLESISIPDSVTHIERGALGNCDNLTSVTWNDNTYQCDNINGSDSMYNGDVANFNDDLVNEGIADETDNIWCITSPE